MDKNSIIGFVLIAAILVGFTFFQSRQFKKQSELQYQADSVARVEALAQARLDSAYAAEHAVADTLAAASPLAAQSAIYKDSLLELSHNAEEQFITIENDKIAVTFTTKGAKPYSVVVKGYKTYSQEELQLFKAGDCVYSVKLYTGEYINTSDFVFNVAESDASHLILRLPFAQGGYIEQKYSLYDGEYRVDNLLSFVGMQNIIPRNVSSFDLDFSVTVPRMEKGYKNESQYSKLAYYFDGDKKPEEMGRSRNGSKRIDSKLSWFAFQQQFFSTIMRAPEEFAAGELGIAFHGDGNEDMSLMTCDARMRCDFRQSDHISVPFEFYFGPNHFQTLKSYNHHYEKIIPLGGSLVGWFTRFVIIPLFNFLHKFIGNFGIIILLMTIFIKIVVLPFAYKSYSSSAKMAALKPFMEKINAKYSGQSQDEQLKKQQATMALYKKAGVSPLGGCLPMLIQFPILWAMFRFFPASIELRQQPFLWADDLSAFDSFIDFGTRIPLLGDHISLFALLMAVSMFFYSKLTTAQQPTANDPNAASMKFMSVYMMPVMMYFICNNLSAGLSYYYLLSNLITIIETTVIKKFFVHPDEIIAKVNAAEGKPAPKSKWQQRLEEAQRLQQQQLREQQKKQRR